jgi:hypothetical protein
MCKNLYLSNKLSNINDYSTQYFIYLRAYSTAQIPVMKEPLAKEIKKNKQNT